MHVSESGKAYNVVIVGSPNVNSGYKLVANTRYPEIARDFERTFAVLKALPVDIFLGAHGSYFSMDTKYARFTQGDARAFVDPVGYQEFVAERERAFRAELTQQKGMVP